MDRNTAHNSGLAKGRLTGTMNTGQSPSRYHYLHGMKLNFKHIIALLSVFILIHVTTATFACTCIGKDKQTTERERVDKFETIDRIITDAVNV